MPGGRPTKYTPEFLKIAKEYLGNYESKHEHAIPSVAGLAEISNIRRETLHVWSNEEGKEEFSNILGNILAKQERLLIGSGLKGVFNSAITKLVLGKHGYHDKQDIGGDQNNPLIPVLNVTIGNKPDTTPETG